VSWQQAKRGQALERQDHPRQSISAGGVRRGGLAISHTKDNYLSAQFHRIARRRGKQKAVVAVSHSVLVILYHMLREGKPYRDLGPDYFEKLEAAQIERYHVRRLEQLGYPVTLTPASAA